MRSRFCTWRGSLSGKACILSICRTPKFDGFVLTFSKCDRDPNLAFVEQVALAPPEVQIDIAQQAQNEAELQQAAQMPLPDGDDDDLLE